MANGKAEVTIRQFEPVPKRSPDLQLDRMLPHPTVLESVSPHGDATWAHWALSLIDNDNSRSADTHLLKLDVPALSGIDIYLKDESTHPTGSLKHRLARSLFLVGICDGRIRRDTPVVEASSGSTAISEAYFARMLGLPFHAVMPASTSPEKIGAIERGGGICHLIEDTWQISAVARDLATQIGGVFLDQFTFAERATDWRGNNNIAESIFRQMSNERHPVPAWIVMSAGTGGTAATLGRFMRYKRLMTRLCVVDPENSVYFDCFSSGSRTLTIDTCPRIEGIGRPHVEPSFIPDVVDHMMKIPDAASLGAMRVLSRRLGRRIGGSTGVNFYGLCRLASKMRASGQEGSLVTLICDSGDRYVGTYYDDRWIEGQGLDLDVHERALDRFLQSGEPLPAD